MIAPRRLWQRPGLRGWIIDVVIAVFLTNAMVGGAVAEALAPVNSIGQTVTSGGHPVVAHASWAVFLLVVVAGLSLVWRRWAPVAVLAVALTCVVVYSMLGYVNGAPMVLVMVALYTVAVSGSSRRALVAGGVTLVSLALATSPPFNPFPPLGGGFLLIPFEVAATVSLGVAVGNRRAYIRAAEERAQQAERTREEEAARRVDAERLRIARELHDVVAHTLSMINVQAGAAAHVAAEHPEQAAAALTAIKVASREGLREMRSILNVLRQVDEVDPTQPAPGLAMIDFLVESANGAGLSTTLRVEGTPQRLPATVDLAAYRIIQESLTNAVRHAGPATATVALGWSETRLCVDVIDTGRGGAGNGETAGDGVGAGAGHGLVGMRERAVAVGGSLQSGPLPDGGFAVHAQLPTGAGQ